MTYPAAPVWDLMTTSQPIEMTLSTNGDATPTAATGLAGTAVANPVWTWTPGAYYTESYLHVVLAAAADPSTSATRTSPDLGDAVAAVATWTASVAPAAGSYKGRMEYVNGTQTTWGAVSSTVVVPGGSTGYKSDMVVSGFEYIEGHVPSGSGAHGSLTKYAGNSSIINPANNRAYGDNDSPGQYYVTTPIATPGQQILANMFVANAGLYPFSWRLRWNRALGNFYQVQWIGSTDLIKIQRFLGNANDFTWNATVPLGLTAANAYDLDINIETVGGNPTVTIAKGGVQNFQQADSNTGKITVAGDCGFIHDGLSNAGLQIVSLDIKAYP